MQRKERGKRGAKFVENKYKVNPDQSDIIIMIFVPV